MEIEIRNLCDFEEKQHIYICPHIKIKNATFDEPQKSRPEYIEITKIECQICAKETTLRISVN